MIYFTMYGPTLLRKDVVDKIGPKGDQGQPLRYFIEQATTLGVRLLVCQPSLALNDLSLEDLIEGVEVIGGAAFNDLAAWPVPSSVSGPRHDRRSPFTAQTNTHYKVAASPATPKCPTRRRCSSTTGSRATFASAIRVRCKIASWVTRTLCRQPSSMTSAHAG